MVSSTYQPPWFQRNGHIQTLYPGIFRKIKGINYERERFILSDGDFVDLDWIDKGAKRVVLLSHGLEGDSSRHYIRGLAKLFSQNNWDVVAWNCRSCSGEMNKKFRLYNHGEIGDIEEVVHHALRRKNYEQLSMVGVSMGGAIIFNYLGNKADSIPEQVRSTVAISAPCDMKSSVELLNSKESTFYRKRFFNMLRPKMEHKAKQFPGKLDISKLKEIKVWKDFDEHFTAPLNGYENAEDFYRKASCRFVMDKIKVPSLLINAKNDPILTELCTPITCIENNSALSLLNPDQGGHVGFQIPGEEFAWSELHALAFCEKQ